MIGRRTQRYTRSSSPPRAVRGASAPGPADPRPRPERGEDVRSPRREQAPTAREERVGLKVVGIPRRSTSKAPSGDPHRDRRDHVRDDCVVACPGEGERSRESCDAASGDDIAHASYRARGRQQAQWSTTPCARVKQFGFPANPPARVVGVFRGRPGWGQGGHGRSAVQGRLAAVCPTASNQRLACSPPQVAVRQDHALPGRRAGRRSPRPRSARRSPLLRARTRPGPGARAGSPRGTPSAGCTAAPK